MKITRPTLLLDEQRCRSNIRRMAEKARRNQVVLRPHFKTHQSHTVGRWFREEGITACTVSSVRMAAYFAEDGWQDITVAFPLNYLEADEINKLAERIKLNLLVVSAEALRELAKLLTHPVHCFIEIDTGYHRTGVDPSDKKRQDEIIQVIESSPLMKFAGLLTHAGQSYQCRSGIEILTVHQQITQGMKRAGSRLVSKFPEMVLSVGDTPTCSKATDFSGIQEIRPGNFVFCDVMQCRIGSCSEDDVAIVLACPVVAGYPERGEIVVHGGGVHLSKDFLKEEDGSMSYGKVVRLSAHGWQLPSLPMNVKSVSQEHGIIRASKADCEQIRSGEILGIIPVHSCMTADVMGEYFTLTGEKIMMMPKT